jgi:hypothetical protein
MGGPGGPRPPGGGVTGAAPPLRGVAEARRAGARGETSPFLNISAFIYIPVGHFYCLPDIIICDVFYTMNGYRIVKW